MAAANGDDTHHNGAAEHLYRVAGEWSANALPGVMFVLACSSQDACQRAEQTGLRVDCVNRVGSGHCTESPPPEPLSPPPASSAFRAPTLITPPCPPPDSAAPANLD